MLDKTIFAQNMTLLAEIYDKQLTNALNSVYYAVLQEMSNEDFKQSIKRLLQERTFATFPKPAEILALSNVKKVEVIEIDQHEEKAKELISLVYAMNDTIYREHIKTGISFDRLLAAAKFPSVSDEDIAILNNVKPHYNLKSLIAGISQYANTAEQLQAFKNAITQSKRGLMIGNEIKMRLGR